MKIRVKTVTTLALAGLIGGTLSISPPLHAQDSAAGQEMHQSGASAKAVVDADPTLQTDLTDIEWTLIARMRDRLTHHYWTTDREVVWSTATLAVPELRTALISALLRLE